MKYNVVIADQAKEQLVACVLFMAGESMPAARALQQRLVEGIRSLESFPLRCPLLNEPYLPAGRYRKLVIEQRYLILYLVQEDMVFVDAVVDGRREMPWLLR